MILGKIKSYALLLLSGIAAVLAIAVKLYKGRADKLEHQRDKYRAQARQAQEIAEAEAEIESEYSDAKREADRDIEEGRLPDSLRNRNNS